MLSFGTDVRLGKARDLRDQARRLLRNGTDPSVDRQEQRKTTTITPRDRTSASLGGGAASAYTCTAGTHRLASACGVNRTYDGNGNTLSGTSSGLTLSYDDRNRLAGAINGGVRTSYAINGRGERVGKTNTVLRPPTGTTLYAYDEGGPLMGEYSGAGVMQAEYIYLDSLPVGVVKGSTLYYVETDHLGTPRQVVKPNGNVVVWKWDFLQNAFGNSATD